MKRLQIFLLILLLTVGVTSAQGTDVYEYATVTTIFSGQKFAAVSISYSDGNYKEIPFEKSELKTNGISYNDVPAVKCLEQLSKEGWETINMTQGVTDRGPVYLLKRKKK